MSWIDVTRSEDNAEYRCHRFARLVRDDTGEEIGSIMQFFADGPCYAIREDVGRLGPRETWEEAVAAVEDPNRAGAPMAFFSPGGRRDA